ncbi:MAG TPA: archaeosortase/exosortase family protein [Steroidobacteraceae bacterium]
MNWLTPEVRAAASGVSIRAVGGGLNVRNGCEGMEALFLLVAGLVIAPIRWRARGVGLLWGIGLVYIVNQARVLTLFYAYRSDPSLFDVLHAVVMPIAVMLIIAMYFYAWIIHSSRGTAVAA